MAEDGVNRSVPEPLILFADYRSDSCQSELQFLWLRHRGNKELMLKVTRFNSLDCDADVSNGRLWRLLFELELDDSEQWFAGAKWKGKLDLSLINFFIIKL